jgi:hypothetical protein
VYPSLVVEVVIVCVKLFETIGFENTIDATGVSAITVLKAKVNSVIIQKDFDFINDFLKLCNF